VPLRRAASRARCAGRRGCSCRDLHADAVSASASAAAQTRRQTPHPPGARSLQRSPGNCAHSPPPPTAHNTTQKAVADSWVNLYNIKQIRVSLRIFINLKFQHLKLLFSKLLFFKCNTVR